MKKTTIYLLVILFLALFIRFLFILHPGFLADIAYWKWWSSASAEKGLVHTINYVNYNYPSFYLYILKLTGHIYLLFAPTNSPNFWNTYNPLFLLLIKIPYILADLGIGMLIFLIVKKLINSAYNKLYRLKLSLIAPLLYLFNPVAIYNSAIWGQTDSLGTFFALFAMYLAMLDKIAISSVVLSLAFFLKVQTNIFILLTFLYIFIRFGISKTIKAIAITTLSSLVLNTPYLLSHTFDKVVDTILTSFNYFPYISLNAYNIPWFLSPPGRPDKILDTEILLGGLTFKTFGLVLFAFALLLSFINLLSTRYKILSAKNSTNDINLALISSSAFSVFAFYMLPTQMHERYIFPIFAFIPILILLKSRELTNKIIFIALTFTILLNLHLVMLLNYPDTTNLLFLPQKYDDPLTKNLALINIAAFILFSWQIIKNINKKIVIGFSLIITLLFGYLAFFPKTGSNSNIVFLSDITPIKAKQGFGQLALNRNLKGERLSSSFNFYDKGLGTHANSEIIYDLEKKYKTFITDFGIDTTTNDASSVEFKILADDKEVFKSGVMKKWDGPKSVKLDVTNVSTLTLLVGDGGDGINNDHADWLNPKLIK